MRVRTSDYMIMEIAGAHVRRLYRSSERARGRLKHQSYRMVRAKVPRVELTTSQSHPDLESLPPSTNKSAFGTSDAETIIL